jgi:DNA-directed RNA polymerase specialized sigma24 family protein
VAADYVPASESADDAVERLYAEHWASLVRLGALLLRDPVSAEEVAQDAFVALHRRWGSVRDQSKALAYLRRSVVNGCRSTQRRSAVAARYVPDAERSVDSAESTVLAAARRAPCLPRWPAFRAGSARCSCCGTGSTCPRRRSRPRCASRAAR